MGKFEYESHLILLRRKIHLAVLRRVRCKLLFTDCLQGAQLPSIEYISGLGKFLIC